MDVTKVAVFLTSEVARAGYGANEAKAAGFFKTIEEANVAMSALHNLAIEGRALRCEVARSDREQGGSRPY